GRSRVIGQRDPLEDGLAPEHLDGPLDQRSRLDARQMRRGGPGESKEVLHESLEALAFAAHHLHQATFLLTQRGREAEQLDRPAHRGERVSYLVRQARGETPYH